MPLWVLYIILYIAAITAESDPAPKQSCTRVTWKNKVYTKKDYKDMLPQSCVQNLIFLNAVGKVFCLAAKPGEGKSEISCTEGTHTSIRLPTDIKPVHYNILLDISVDSYTTEGTVDIKLDVLKATKQIILHSNPTNITIKQVTLLMETTMGR